MYLKYVCTLGGGGGGGYSVLSLKVRQGAFTAVIVIVIVWVHLFHMRRRDPPMILSFSRAACSCRSR